MRFSCLPPSVFDYIFEILFAGRYALYWRELTRTNVSPIRARGYISRGRSTRRYLLLHGQCYPLLRRYQSCIFIVRVCVYLHRRHYCRFCTRLFPIQLGHTSTSSSSPSPFELLRSLAPPTISRGFYFVVRSVGASCERGFASKDITLHGSWSWHGVTNAFLFFFLVNSLNYERSATFIYPAIASLSWVKLAKHPVIPSRNCKK